MADTGKKMLPRPLSAKYTSDFAYITVRDRLPVILTKVIDVIHRSKYDIAKKYGEKGSEGLKLIIGMLSRLKNEMQTNKLLLPIKDSLSDVNLWDAYLDQDTKEQGDYGSKWFVSAWLYTECYFYRRIKEAFELSSLLKSIDPFGQQKQQGLHASMEAAKAYAVSLKQILTTLDSTKKEDLKAAFCQLFQVCLWGNKCDLSISSGAENPQKEDPLSQLKKFESNILVDDTNKVWEILQEVQNSSPGKVRVDIVLDNAGFEFLTDLGLAEFLMTTKLVNTIHFHGKAMPWFVSDVTKEDTEWTLETLSVSGNQELQEFAAKWKENIVNKTWIFKFEDFWTLPHAFNEMKTTAPDLFEDLSQAHVILFKGDLNYRKLTLDRKWDPTTPFSEALQGFHPAPLCSLRTLKCDLIVGLKEGVAEKIEKEDSNWLICGKYGVIAFDSKE